MRRAGRSLRRYRSCSCGLGAWPETMDRPAELPPEEQGRLGLKRREFDFDVPGTDPYHYGRRLAEAFTRELRNAGEHACLLWTRVSVAYRDPQRALVTSPWLNERLLAGLNARVDRAARVVGVTQLLDQVRVPLTDLSSRCEREATREAERKRGNLTASGRKRRR